MVTRGRNQNKYVSNHYKSRLARFKIRRKYKKITKKVNSRPRPRFKKKIKRGVKASTRPAAIKQSPLPLNIDFYSAVDGVYTSYWAGKLISTLQLAGKKKTVARHFYRAAIMIKLSVSINPLLLLLETLDKIKPTFRLRNRIRRTTIKEYPIVVLRPRQIILAVHWLKEEIQANSGVFGTALGTEIAGKLLDFKLNPKKNNLIKKRDEYMKRTVKAQFNIRYNFKK